LNSQTTCEKLIVHTTSPAETRLWAARLAAYLQAGDFVALCGPLGAGKTPLPLCHADAYRINNSEELEAAGLLEYLSSSVVALEWAEQAPEVWPEQYFLVRLSFTDEGRRLELSGHGPRPSQIISEMPMRILGIETSGDISSVALLAGNEIIREEIFASRRTICQVLVGHILSVVGAETIVAAHLDGIAVSSGPASFTGLRVGVTTAKTLAYSCQIPVVGISTPLAWAAEAQAEPGAMVVVLQPARRHRLYLTTFLQAEEALPEQQGETRVVDIENTTAVCSDVAGEHPLVVTGNGLLSEVGLVEVLASNGRVSDLEIDSPRASTIAWVGAVQIEDAPPDSYFSLRPNYLMVSQAERGLGVNLGL